MPASGEVVLRQGVCQRNECHAVFFVCSRCERGQRYCSHTCSHRARLLQHRHANRRYQSSREGKRDHCQRQEQYRQRRAQSIVTDHSSNSISFPASSDCEKVEAAVTDTPRPSRAAELPRWTENWPGVCRCCRVCGRTGSVVSTFSPLVSLYPRGFL